MESIVIVGRRLDRLSILVTRLLKWEIMGPIALLACVPLKLMLPALSFIVTKLVSGRRSPVTLYLGHAWQLMASVLLRLNFRMLTPSTAFIALGYGRDMRHFSLALLRATSLLRYMMRVTEEGTRTLPTPALSAEATRLPPSP